MSKKGQFPSCSARSQRPEWVDCVEKLEFWRRSHFSRPYTTFGKLELPVRPEARPFSVRLPQSICGVANQRKRHSISKGAISADAQFSTFSTQSTDRRFTQRGSLRKTSFGHHEKGRGRPLPTKLAAQSDQPCAGLSSSTSLWGSLRRRSETLR
jgi:hypothetical protein